MAASRLNAVSPLALTGHRHAFDRLRAWGAVLVVILHASNSYLLYPMPGLVWHVRHPQPNAMIDGVFWLIAGFIMPLFLVVSGYCAAQSLEQKTPWQFFRARRKRVLLPFILAAACLLPLELYLWLITWVADGHLEPVKLRSLKLGPYHAGLWGFSHLWYLQYLFLYSALLAAATHWGRHWAPVQKYWGQRGQKERLAIRLCCLAVAAGVSILLLTWQPRVVVGFQHSFAPVASKFAWCGLFFLWGVVWRWAEVAARPQRPDPAVPPHEAVTLKFPAAFDESSGALRRLAPEVLVATGLISLAVLLSVMGMLRQDPNGFSSILLATVLTIWAASAVLLLWRVAERLPGTPSSLTRYLSEASFWIYLVHHPIVAIWQLGLRETGWSAMSQFLAVIAGTCACCLGLYEVAVRRTALGALLNGTPQPRPSALSENQEHLVTVAQETIKKAA